MDGQNFVEDLYREVVGGWGDECMGIWGFLGRERV